MVRQLTIQLSQSQPVANQRFVELLYADHPYGRLFPTEERVRGYTIDDVRGFHQAVFGARRAHVYVVGQFDESAVEKAIRESFATWDAGPEPARKVPEMRSERAVHLVDRPGAPQSTLRIGLPALDPTHDDYMALVVTNALLGGSFGSRITSNIRENKGYTYSPYSSVTTHYRSAHWVQNADVTTAVTGASLKEIFYEIERLREQPPTAEELEGIQNYLAGIFVLQNSSRGGIIIQLAKLRLHGLDDSFLTNYVKNIHAVTPQRMQEIAKRYIRPDEMTIVVVGDRSKVTSQLEPYR
jgi:predicted Zn-dependent peptidase